MLSPRDTIRGKLHIQNIKYIKENGKFFEGVYSRKLDDGEIFHFAINQNKVELQIIWSTYSPNPPQEDFSTIEIEAEKIWWENIPDLEVT